MAKNTNVDRIENIKSIIQKTEPKLERSSEIIDREIKNIKENIQSCLNVIEENSPQRGYTFPAAHKKVKDKADETFKTLKEVQEVENNIDEFIEELEEFLTFYRKYMDRVEDSKAGIRY